MGVRPIIYQRERSVKSTWPIKHTIVTTESLPLPVGIVVVGDSGDTGLLDETGQSHSQQDLHGDGQRILGDDQVSAKAAHKRLKRDLQESGEMREENPPGPTRRVETKPMLILRAPSATAPGRELDPGSDYRRRLRGRSPQ